MEKIDNIGAIVAQNLVYYRKKANLTQLQLAEALNYSDKAISKWERGEGVPDIFVLKQIADIFNIPIESLLHLSEKDQESKASSSRNHVMIALLGVGGAWLIATLAYFFIEIFMPHTIDSWLTFIIALPISFVILLIFNAIWGKKLFHLIIVSGLIWALTLTIFLCLYIPKNINIDNIYLIFVVAIPVQAIAIFWHFLDFKKKK